MKVIIVEDESALTGTELQLKEHSQMEIVAHLDDDLSNALKPLQQNRVDAMFSGISIFRR